MFREITKKKNALDLKDSLSLLKTERRGVLSINGDNGYPYSVPINYYYEENSNKIFFHSARVGYKVELIRNNSNVCFTVYGNQTIKDESWAPYMSSVVVFGKCHNIEDETKKVETLRKFANKYYPSVDLVNKEIDAAGKGVLMFEIEIEHISGKQVQEK